MRTSPGLTVIPAISTGTSKAKWIDVSRGTSVTSLPDGTTLVPYTGKDGSRNSSVSRIGPDVTQPTYPWALAIRAAPEPIEVMSGTLFSWTTIALRAGIPQ